MKMAEQDQLEAAKQIPTHIEKPGKGQCSTLLYTGTEGADSLVRTTRKGCISLKANKDEGMNHIIFKEEKVTCRLKKTGDNLQYASHRASLDEVITEPRQ